MIRFSDLQNKKIKTPLGNINYRIHYSSKNTDNILVLIHGLAASGKSWTRFVEQLPDTFTIIIPDLLGHGDSDAPKIDYHVSLQEEIVRDILENEQIKKYSIMGHSYGGWVAALLARSNPSITALILEDAGGLKGFFDEVVGTEKREQYKKDLLKKALQINANEYVVKSIIEDEFSSSQITENDLQSITAPTLIIWGDEDTTIDKKFAYIFKKYIHNCSVKIIKNSKHTSHYSNPKETRDIVVNFLELLIKK